jgi:hypothetical protein
MYQQRAPLDAEAYEMRDELWQPDLPANAEAQQGDAYVVVDELLDGAVTLAVTPWPRLDRAGRLRFSGELNVVHQSADAFEAQVIRARARSRQRSARRPLRIGDVFLARPGATHPAEWRTLFDVSGDAREMAKIAFYGAAAPVARDPQRWQVEAPAQASDASAQADAGAGRNRRPPGPTARAAV